MSMEHLLPAERIEAGGRLVEQHQLRIADERLGELGALTHAGGEPADRAEAGLVEADEVEDVGGPLASGARRQPTELAERGDHVGRGLVERQAVVLGHEPELGAHRDRVGGHVDAAHLDRPLGRMGEPEQHAEHRRLACAIGPDETDEAARHLEGETVDRSHAGIALGESVDAEQRSRGHDAVESGRSPSARRPRRGDPTSWSQPQVASAARCSSEWSRWSWPNGGKWMTPRTSSGTPDQSYVSVTLVADPPSGARS